MAYAGIVYEKIEALFLLQEFRRSFLDGFQILQINPEAFEIELLVGRGLLHLLDGRGDALGRTSGNVYPGAAQGELPGGLVANATISCVEVSAVLGDRLGW